MADWIDVNCPKCQKNFQLEIRSRTLSQVVKCPLCTRKFTFDPVKEIERQELQGREELERKERENREAEAKAESKKSMSSSGEQIPTRAAPHPPVQGHQKVACPGCAANFDVQIISTMPDDCKTQCPGCRTIFSFRRERIEERGMQRIKCIFCRELFAVEPVPEGQNEGVAACPSCGKKLKYKKKGKPRGQTPQGTDTPPVPEKMTSSPGRETMQQPVPSRPAVPRPQMPTNSQSAASQPQPPAHPQSATSQPQPPTHSQSAAPQPQMPPIPSPERQPHPDPGKIGCRPVCPRCSASFEIDVPTGKKKAKVFCPGCQNIFDYHVDSSTQLPQSKPLLQSAGQQPPQEEPGQPSAPSSEPGTPPPQESSSQASPEPPSSPMEPDTQPEPRWEAFQRPPEEPLKETPAPFREQTPPPPSGQSLAGPEALDSLQKASPSPDGLSSPDDSTPGMPAPPMEEWGAEGTGSQESGEEEPSSEEGDDTPEDEFTPYPPQDITEQDVICPDCDLQFTVKLPEEKKPEGTTICPLCHVKFAFDRLDWHEEYYQDEEWESPDWEESTDEEDEYEDEEWDGYHGDTQDDADADDSWEDDEGTPADHPGDTGPTSGTGIVSGEAPPRDDSSDTPPAPAEKSPGTKQLDCPACEARFSIDLPDNEKEELKTICPACHTIFSFQRHTDAGTTSAITGDTGHGGDADKGDPVPPPPPPPPPPAEPEKARKPGKGFLNSIFKKKIDYLRAFSPSLELAELKRTMGPGVFPSALRTRTGAAALLLVFAAILGLFAAIFTAASTPDDDSDRYGGSVVYVIVTVFEGNDLGAGAEVTLDGNEPEFIFDGSQFHFGNVTGGDHRVVVSKEGFGNQTLKFTVTENNLEDGFKNLEVYLVTQNRTMDERVGEGTGSLTPVYIFSLLMALASLAALGGAAFALMRRHFTITILCAVLGVLSFGFLIGSFCSLGALVLVLLSRERFK